MSIRAKLVSIVLCFTLIALALTGVSYFATDALSTVRAYVGGEGLWSKGQKNAIYWLARYALERKPEFYKNFEKNLNIPLGDHQARIELERAHTDFSVADQGFIKGGNDLRDVRAMGHLFKRFRKVSYIDRAITIWGAADVSIAQLQEIGESLHRSIESNTQTRTQVRDSLSQIDEINRKLTDYENQFSYTLGEAARWLKKVLVVTMTIFAFSLLSAGLWIAYLVLRGIFNGIAALEEGARSIEEGDLAQRIKISSNDELSRLARSFNQMADCLLVKTEELVGTSKMASLGEMAAGIAHEINTPLTIIGMRISQIEECLQDKDYSSLNFLEAIATVKKTAHRIAKIVAGLRSFARDDKDAPMEALRLSTLFDDTLSLCRERFAAHGINVEVAASDQALSILVETRPIELSQVLLNLLNNAFDAIQPLPEKWVRIEVLENHDFAQISVTDSGKGIPKEVQAKLMQPFFTTKDLGKGTGLGLSISKGIMESHRGRLYLDAGFPNTRFVIEIPKAAKGAKERLRAA